MMKKTNTAKEKNAERPSLHNRILRDVKEKILSGTWPPGHQIPFEITMATEYGCSRMTVNKALTQLSREGILERNKKRGTFVKAPQSVSAAFEITNIQKEVEDSGESYSYKLLHDAFRSASELEAQLLGLKKLRNIRSLTCLHSANDRPFCFEQRIVNVNAAPQIEQVKFENTSPGAWMLSNIPWNSAKHQIIATSATEDVARMLKIALGDACLVIERRTQNKRGYITWARLTYAGEQHRLVTNFTPAD